MSRALDELRSVNFELDYVIYPEGSVLISMGNTRVLCNATVQETLPAWLKYDKKKHHGWVDSGVRHVAAQHSGTQQPRNGNAQRSHAGDSTLDCTQFACGS